MRPTQRTGTQSRRVNFSARFRLAAREYIGFQKRLAKLGPQYLSCNERQSNCTRKKAEPRKGCPNCEFTIQNKAFHKELGDKMNRLPRTTRRGMRLWTEKKIHQTVQEIASLANSVKTGTGRKWSVPTSILVNIYRDELGKIKVLESIQMQNDVDRMKQEGLNQK